MIIIFTEKQGRTGTNQPPQTGRLVCMLFQVRILAIHCHWLAQSFSAAYVRLSLQIVMPGLPPGGARKKKKSQRIEYVNLL